MQGGGRNGEDRDRGRRVGRRASENSIIGTGMVGASLAYTLALERPAGELVLMDVNEDRALGEAMDISHALPFVAPTAVAAGGYDECRGSDVVVITAGLAQKAGESRLSLAKRNFGVYQGLVPRIAAVAAAAIALVVSNPEDVLTYAALKLSGFPRQRIIGSGTVLDTARFRYELSAHCSVDPRNVHAYILGNTVTARCRPGHDAHDRSNPGHHRQAPACKGSTGSRTCV